MKGKRIAICTRKRIVAAVIFAVLAISLAAVFAFDTRLLTVEYVLESDKIDGTVKLCLITDLHSCEKRYGEGGEKLLLEIDRYAPDIVLLGGDIFDDVSANDNAYAFVKNIGKGYPTFYVSGNHEWWSEETEDMFSFLGDNGITVLRGASASVSVGGDELVICGVDDPDVDIYDPVYTAWDSQLEKASLGVSDDVFSVLLSHRPERIEKYSEYGFDLILSGHAHGGQWRIPLLVNGIYAPHQGVFPKYAGGLYKVGDASMIVSRGLSVASTRIPRIFNRPELVFVTLN